MSARTVATGTALVAHVPVDRVEIVMGAGETRCMQAQQELHQHTGEAEPYYANLDFTLMTAASTTRSFRRTLKMATIFNVDTLNGWFEFTAIFSGRIVSGRYNMQSNTGWFSPASATRIDDPR